MHNIKVLITFLKNMKIVSVLLEKYASKYQIGFYQFMILCETLEK